VKLEDCLTSTWSNLRREFLGEEHLRQVARRSGHDLEFDGAYEALQAIDAEILNARPWADLGWQQLEEATTDLVHELPWAGRALFNASRLLHHLTERLGNLSPPRLVDVDVVEHFPREFQSYGGFVAQWVNPLLGMLFTDVRVFLPSLCDLSADLSPERYREWRAAAQRTMDYDSWALSAARSLLRQVRFALDIGIRGAFELEQPSPPPKSKRTKGRWCHMPDEQRPDTYCLGPLSGQRKILAKAITERDDPRLLEECCRLGQYWAVKQRAPLRFEIWFDERYQEAFDQARARLEGIRGEQHVPSATTT
jgi:hypothetical protein